MKEPGQLSPPMVGKPIHECAEAVHIYGFIPHATVTVYANTTERVGEASPHFGFADISLSRPLKLGDSITATQTVDGVTSDHSILPVVVSALPDLAGGFNKPVVHKDLYECGVLVPVSELVPSVRVRVYEDGADVGSGPAAGNWLAVWTSPLHAGRKVTAKQIACPDEPGSSRESPLSDPVTVKGAPTPTPPPQVDPNSLYAGNDAVVLTNLLVGAIVTVYDNGVAVGAGGANASANWCPIDPPLHAGSVVTAVQELCGNPSVPSDPARPEGELTAPVVVAPICRGAQFAVIQGTVINANVVLFRNGAIAGYGGAVAGELVLALGGGAKFQTGDVVTARQYFGATVSPVSNAVTVVSGLAAPVVEIGGGEPFFLAEAGEQQIDGAVFPRGRGNGPQIRIHSCCDKDARVAIYGPNGQLVGEPVATEVFPGYLTAQWDWGSAGGWSVPNGVPVGQYSVRVRTGCDQREVEQPFYVIFNPEDVGGPSRFSFNETGVWFGAGPNFTRALAYYLHPDDARVFTIAIGAAKGLTDPQVAAEKICAAEEAKFGYGLSWTTDDTITLLTGGFTECQCADDANLLTALLRSVGIPAHPATGDAQVETGAATWNFDTWTELLVPQGGGAQWLVLHPHQYPSMSPESRGLFGTTRSVASKQENDVVVMGGENWVWSEVADSNYDVNWTRNGCDEPEKTLSKRAWIGELCEEYWAPNTHWGCEGDEALRARGSEAPAWGFKEEWGEVRWGDSLAGWFTFTNPEAESVRGEVVFEVVGDLPESMAFPDVWYSTSRSDVVVDAGAAGRVPFTLELPPTAEPGRDLYVRARLDRRTLSVRPIPLRREIAADLRVEDRPVVGDQVTIAITVANVGDRALEGVDVSVAVPYALRVRTSEVLRDGTLGRGERLTRRLIADVAAPLEAGAIRLEVRTRDGGGAVAVEPITVPDPSLPDAGPIGEREG